MRFMDMTTMTGFRQWRRIFMAAIMLAVATPALEFSGADLAIVGSAYADDDDDDDDDGGGSRGRGGRSGSGGGYGRSRGNDDSHLIWRKLFGRERPAVRRARPARAAPLPVRAPNEIVAFGISE